MKTYILVLAVGLFSFSTSHAQWTEEAFDISKVHMSISGQVSVDSNGLNLSRAIVTAFLPKVSAKWNGTPYGIKIAVRNFAQPDGASVSVADLICRKMGKHLRQSHEEDTGAFDNIAFLDQNLIVESISTRASGRRVYGDIECL